MAGARAEEGLHGEAVGQEPPSMDLQGSQAEDSLGAFLGVMTALSRAILRHPAVDISATSANVPQSRFRVRRRTTSCGASAPGKNKSRVGVVGEAAREKEL